MEWMISAAAGLLAGLVVAYLWMRTKVAPLRATLVLREEECESLKQKNVQLESENRQLTADVQVAGKELSLLQDQTRKENNCRMPLRNCLSSVCRNFLCRTRRR